ncbi:N-carbamoylputrescine amidase, partial [Escherichia coli]|nr:N-carbamoylputrescine amidase [Escherichia coli]
QANIDKTIGFVREAAGRGAQVILPSELFQGPYFCVSQEEHWFAHAYAWREHPCVTALSAVAKELGVAIPVSIFEKDGPQ